MELKDFQQTVLDNLDQYLDELVLQRENYVKIEKLKQENPDVEIALPDFTENAWLKMRNAGALPSARANIAFSPRKDGVNRHVPAVSLKIPTGGGKTLLRKKL
jgi:type III restriction enzyme